MNPFRLRSYSPDWKWTRSTCSWMMTIASVPRTVMTHLSTPRVCFLSAVWGNQPNDVLSAGRFEENIVVSRIRGRESQG